jgi:hypothetical protein
LQPATAVAGYLSGLPAGESVLLQVEVADDGGERRMRDVRLTLPGAGAGEPLSSLGFVTEMDGEQLRVLDIAFMSPAEAAGLEPGFTRRIGGYYRELPQPSGRWFLFPPLLLLIGVAWLQYRRIFTKRLRESPDT